MPARTSVELHSDGCRIVDVVVRQTPGDVHVRAFVPNLPRDEQRRRRPDLTASLRQARTDHALARDACVTIWGLRSSYQFLRLPPAKDSDLDALAVREARREIAPLEVDRAGACVALMVGPDIQVGTHRRREVSLIAVSEADVLRQIQPIVDAGFVVRRVVTPAMALTAVARSAADLLPGSTMAYVAIAAQAICVAIVRDGVLLFAREIPWGHSDAGDEPLDARLTSEIRQSMLFFRQMFRAGMDGVVLCGDAPNLRALTAPLSTALSVPVRTLDSLTGIDAEHVPHPADVFRAEVASLRMAIAVGAEPLTPANLLPSSIRNARDTRTAAVRSVAALAAGVLIVAGWNTTHLITSLTTVAASMAYDVWVFTRPAQPSPSAVASPPIETVSASGPVVTVEEPVAATDPTTVASPPNVDLASAPEWSRNPFAGRGQQRREAPVAPAVEVEPDPELIVVSILHSADRRLAVVNGTIVRAGDRVGSSTIVEIQPRAVVIESSRGVRRLVELRVAPITREAAKADLK